jgi:hypothetical protein
MAEAVIDRLEILKVEEQHREVPLSILAAGLKQTLQRIEKIIAVGQASKRVVVGGVTEVLVAFLQRLAAAGQFLECLSSCTCCSACSARSRSASLAFSIDLRRSSTNRRNVR